MDSENSNHVISERKTDNFNPTNNLSTNELIYIIFKVFDYFLDNLNDIDKLSVPHIFVSGEFDSNQTEFERKCNQLQIGVLSSFPSIGKACLPLLRAIIDDNLDGLFFGLTFMNKEEFEKNTHPAKVANILAELESQYGSSHPITQNPNVTLMGIRNDKVENIVVTKTVDQMDLYTLPRIVTLFYDLVLEEIDEEKHNNFDAKALMLAILKKV